MRRIRYHVASSLDGYIAGPRGEFDWIVADPHMDFTGLFEEFDTFLLGRRTYELVLEMDRPLDGEVYVFSTTLRPEDHPGVTIVSDGLEETLNEIRARPGKDIWLFGGGELFRSLLELNQVDIVQIVVIPILLGGGIPLLPAAAPRTPLTLVGHRVYEQSGTVSLEYAVDR